MGMLAAVEAWTTRDHDGEWKIWLSYLDLIARQVTQIEGLSTEVVEPTGPSNVAPTLQISWDPLALHITGEEVAENFARNKPRIAIGGSSTEDKTSIHVTPSQMQPGEAEVVAERIHGILSETRTPKPVPMTATADIDGHWDLTVEYFTSSSEHRLFLQQGGNWVQGMHQSDFSNQEINGTVEGNHLKLQSVARHTADGVPFLFSGEINQDEMAGSIHLGEYLTARFTARRAHYNTVRRSIEIPSGPPLAT